MKIVVSERQYSILNELKLGGGKLRVEPISDFFSTSGPLGDFKNSKLVNLTRTFLKNNLGTSFPEMTDSQILSYISDLSINDLRGHSKSLKNSDIAPMLSYYLAKNLFEFEDGFGVKYFSHQRNDITTYWFFDPEIKQLFGYMKLEPFRDGVKGSMKVSFVAIDEVFQGRGYGKIMYLNVINDVKYLYSDNFLFKDSLNIWVNILPKYFKVFAVVYPDPEKGFDSEYVLINKNKFIDPSDVRYFMTSKNWTK